MCRLGGAARLVVDCQRFGACTACKAPAGKYLKITGAHYTIYRENLQALPHRSRAGKMDVKALFSRILR